MTSSPSKTAAFFDALFGDAEEGAYDIRLRFQEQKGHELHFAFQLIQRPGKCLACNLTYGLPQVFARHPVLAVDKMAASLCGQLGTPMASWTLSPTREISKSLHAIPLVIKTS